MILWRDDYNMHLSVVSLDTMHLTNTTRSIKNNISKQPDDDDDDKTYNLVICHKL